MGRRSVSIVAVAGAAFILGVSCARAVDGISDVWTGYIAIGCRPFAASTSYGARSHGVALCTLSVSNRSEVTRTVRLSSEGGADYRQDCTLAPGAFTHVTFTFLPQYAFFPNRLGVEIDGVAKGHFDLPSFPWQSIPHHVVPLVILSPSMSETAVKYRAEVLTPADANGNRPKRTAWHNLIEESTFLVGQLPVAEWPTEWQAYTPADCIVLTNADWESAPPDVRGALLGFIQAGGCLILAGATAADLARHDIHAGFGAVQTLSSPVTEDWTSGDFDLFALATSLSSDRWRSVLDMAVAFPTDTFFSPPKVAPVYAVLLCIMLFLGPVLVIVLSVRNQRIRIYWLAPCIAVATSVVILLFALFRDGVSPITHAQALLYLNEKSGTQVQLATLSVMAPAGLSSPLHFGPTAEVMLAPSSQQNDSARKTVRNGEELVLGKGWVPARAPVTFLLRDAGKRSVPVLAPDASAEAFAKVTNPYPATIQNLRYCDAAGNNFMLDAPLAPGATAQMPRCADMPGAKMNILADASATFFKRTPLATVSDAYLASPPQYPYPLPPATYLCEVEGTPFTEHPIRRGKVRHAGKTLILGEMPL
ncbi:MAG: hypothetical protein FWG50_08770 [Kiritimatiellaeota bacterium]|nr:hypothetical protein [Kiritimatiellota bacterium]